MVNWYHSHGYQELSLWWDACSIIIIQWIVAQKINFLGIKNEEVISVKYILSTKKNIWKYVSYTTFIKKIPDAYSEYIIDILVKGV